MIAIASFFVLSAILGLLLVYLLKIDLLLEEKIFWGLLSGSVFLSAAAFIFSWFLGFNGVSVIASFTALMLSVGVFSWIRRFEILAGAKADFKYFRERLRAGKLNIFFIMLLVALAIFGTLWPKVLYPQDGALYVVGTSGVYGDWAAHSSYVSHFANSSVISLDHPLYSGAKFTYTFMPDFMSAVLIKLGADMIPAMVIPGFIFTIALVVLLYFFALRLIRKESAAALAVCLFFFGGGLGFLYFFQDITKTPFDIMTFMKTSPLEYAHLADKNIHWTALVNNLILPQRAFTLGAPFAILVLTSILIGLKEKKNKMFLIAGVLASFLPAIHIHSLFAVSFAAFFLIILFSQNNARLIMKRLLYFFAPLAILASWQVLYLFPGNGYSFKVQLGWMAKDENWVSFWLKNLGLIAVLFPFAFYAAKRRMKIFYLPFLLLFIITNIFLFQPHDYDNIKIMEYWFLVTSVILAAFLVDLWKKNILGKLIVIVFFPFLILAPVLDLVHLYIRDGYQELSKGDLEVAELIKERTPANSIFLTSDQHNHPVPMLTGRTILMGYRGWLWTYGFDYSKRANDISEMFSGGIDAKNLLKQYKVDYVFIGPSERYTWKANEQFFDLNYPIVVETNTAKVYKVSDN